MSTPTRLNLNLASQPKRNRRLFLWTVFVLAVPLLVLMAVSGSDYIRYSGQLRKTRVDIQDLERRTNEAQREFRRLSVLVEEDMKSLGKRVDLINRLILRKSFSWTGFLSDLEEMLPDSCYITSLSPVLQEGARMEVRLRVASMSLNDLLEFMTRLTAKGFSGIRVNSEIRTENDFLLWDMVFSGKRAD